MVGYRAGSHVHRVSGAVNRGDATAALKEAPADGGPGELRDWRTEPGILKPLSADEQAEWDAAHRTLVTHRRNVPMLLIRNGRRSWKRHCRHGGCCWQL